MVAPSGDDDRPQVSPRGTRGWRTEKVAMGVAREIVRGLAGLPAGAVLPGEAEMVERYGASRSSVREALRILEAQGLIMMRPGPGGGPVLIGAESSALGRTQTLFFHLQGARYTDLLNSQAAFEPMMARLAAENPDQEQKAVLERFVDLELADITSDDQYTTQGFGFHRALMEASGNPILRLLALSISDIVRARIGTHAFTEPEDRQAMLDDHSRIARAVLAGDVERSEKLMTEHMSVYCMRIAEDRSGLINEIVDWH
jgi:DNA-binding FadR family transcriptional regulator